MLTQDPQLNLPGTLKARRYPLLTIQPIKAWWRRVRRWWQRPPEMPPGGISPALEYAIDDGVDYSRPASVPSEVAARGRRAVEAYLTETNQRLTKRFQFDGVRSAMYDSRVIMPTEDPLVEWSYGTRRQVLANCHAAYHRNPIAKRAIDLTRHFAVGKGFTLACRNQDVQRVLDDFRSNPENAIQENEKTFLQDLGIDGELFIRKFSGGGQPGVIVPLRPWDILEIETEPGFFRRALRYHLQYGDPLTGEQVDEWIPADEILHVAINRHSYELRGRPDLFVILPWLRAYKEWIENRARQNKWRNALLWKVTIKGASPGMVARKVTQYRQPPPDGSIIVSSDKEQWEALANPAGANDVSEDGRQIRMMSAIGVGLAEYMLGDGENANLATATAQELPALWKFTDAQQIMAEQVWTPIFRWVIEEAIRAGALDKGVEVQDADGEPIRGAAGRPEIIPALETFSVEYPDLRAGDPKTLAEALAIAAQHGWVSAETAAGEMGYDYPKERKRIKRERDAGGEVKQEER